MRSVNIVDLFCGGGGTSTGAIRAAESRGLRVELCAVNHWEIAIETHARNHPAAKHLCKAIDQVRPREAVRGQVDLLLASPECFPAGTLILTKDGLVPIEKVAVGELVMTHLRRWRRVTAVMKSNRETVIVRGHGHWGLETTAEHPFLCKTRKKHWPKGGRNGVWRWSDAEWFPAADCEGKFWSSPSCFPSSLARGGDEFAWFVGRWLGDGSASLRDGRGGEVVICCGKHEADAIQAKVFAGVPSGVNGSRRDVRTATLFEFWSKELAAWLIDNFGKLAHGKTIPAWVLGAPESWRRSLMEGYLSADGHFNGRKQEATTVSRRLAIGIRLLSESLGNRVAIHKAAQHCDEIEGRKLKVRPVYRIMWVADPKHQYASEMDGFSWSKVASVTPSGESKAVFNLSVEDDESYIADGIVVHNCTHHSVARGGMPINDQSRMSAWEVIRWASELLPRRIIVENVKEFQTWGPIGSEGRPLKSRKGETFSAWCQALRSLGYRLDMRVLNAANFGGATTSERLFVQAVRGRASILWPSPSHAQRAGESTLFESGMKAWKPAREIIDWSLPSQSIFTRKKPLAAATLARIEAGLRKFGGRAADPFLVVLRNHQHARSINAPVPTICTSGAHLGLCQPFVIGQQSCSAPRGVDSPVPTIATAGAVSLVQSFMVPFFGERDGQAPRTHSVDHPTPTVTGQGAGALVQPFIVPFNGNRDRDMERARLTDSPLPTITAGGNRFGIVEPYIIPLNHGGRDLRSHSMAEPMPTITTIDAWAMVEPLLVEYNGEGDAHPVSAPTPTITTRDRFGLAQFAGGAYLDIHFRMLQPHELAAAMGFPADYYFHGNREQKVKQIGNAVHVDQAEALVGAGLEEYCA